MNLVPPCLKAPRERPGRRERSRLRARDQAGSALVEVMVSGVLIVIVAVGVLGTIESATRATAEERHRAQAQSITEADQARMRTMQVTDLASLNQTRTVTQSGTPYAVVSRGQYVTEGTGTEECTDDATGINASYVKLTSTVTWPSIGSRPPVVTQSVVADRLRGLAVAVVNGEGDGVPGIGVSGTGAGSFSGTTGPTGCARFGGLAEGNYTLNISTPGYVDEDGNPPTPQTVSVVDGSMNVVVVVYDNPGTIPVTFRVKPYGATSGTTPVTTSGDTVMAFNTGMSGAKMFGTAGTRSNTVTASSLFPFTSPYAVYGGTCESDQPGSGAALGSVLVPRGGTQSASLQQPALFLTAMSGTSGSPGSPVVGATVRIADRNCPDDPTTAFKRSFTTGAAGRLIDPLNTGSPTRPPGLPMSSYDICVRGTASDGQVRGVQLNNVSVQNLSTGTTQTVFLRSGSTSTTCPA